MIDIRKRVALIPFVFTVIAVPPGLRYASRAPGYAITMEVASSLETEKLVMTLKFAGQNLRLEPDLTAMAGSDVNMAQMTKGAFLLPQPNGKVVFVIPGMGTAMRMDANEIGGTNAPAQRCDTVSVEDLGVGETILGVATRKYRMRARLQAKGDRPTGDEVTEMWIATSLPQGKGVFKRFAKTFGNQIGSAGCPDQFSKFPEGFPLRIKSTKPGPRGPETETTIVTSIKQMTFPDSDFAIPAGMNVMDGNPFEKRGSF